MMRLLVLVSSLSLLSACSVFRTAPPVYTNPDLPRQWEAEGKAALRSANKGVHIYFTWHQDDEQYRIIVRGPLGLGRAEINAKPGEVRIESDRLKQEVSADSLENLIGKLTGRRVPASHALHWMKAEAATPEARVSRDMAGKLTRIKEDGWTIHYLEWSKEAPNLPRRLTVEGPEGKATVVIGLWRLRLDPNESLAGQQPDTASNAVSDNEASNTAAP